MTTDPDTQLTATATDRSLADQFPWKQIIFAFLAALGTLLMVYLIASVPGSWFPSTPPLAWKASDLVVARGAGTVTDGALQVTATDSSGAAIVSLTTDFQAGAYPVVAWTAQDVPEKADIRLLWRSEYSPQTMHSVAVEVEAGHLRPSVLAGNPAWLGRILGLALVIRTPLPQPLRIAGLQAKPTGAIGVLADRGREWLTPERWSGTSINTVTGGADVQDLPLPLLLASAVALAAALVWGWKHVRRNTTVAILPAIVAGLFVTAWFLLDARWTMNLAGQAARTHEQYAGKDWRGKHAAAEDGPLFAFIEEVRGKLPSTPVRIFVASDAHYFRSRAAYHLYPYNVYADPYSNVLPPPDKLRAGDWVVVYQRRGIQYDASVNKLRWDGHAPLAAELRLSRPGAALFEIR